MANFLDKTGLSHFWEKIKSYVDGKSARLRTVTLDATGWSGNLKTVSVPGVLADETKQAIHMIPANEESYLAAGIKCVSQGANTLTFQCKTVPTQTLTVYVVIIPLVTS